MKDKCAGGLVLLMASMVSMPASAAIVSVSGPVSTRGVAAEIIDPPGDVGDDAAENEGQQGFNEQQGVTLAEDLAVDDGTIPAGTTVDSHMIFFNTANVEVVDRHLEVVWEFDGEVLGVMSDGDGNLEAASNAILGFEGTLYPGAFLARGLELDRGDSYTVAGNQLTLSMNVMEPGDWIRVVTASIDDVLTPVIDVRPRNPKNLIKPKSKGKVIVAVLTTSTAQGEPLDFDALQVNPDTVKFGPAGAPALRWRVFDVDWDGDPDLVFKFRIRSTGIACGDTEAVLTGETFAGEAFSASDRIKTLCYH